MIFGFKTRRELKHDLETASKIANINNVQLKAQLQKVDWFKQTVNKIVFENNYQDAFNNSALLVLQTVCDKDACSQDIDNNATLYYDDENKYLYLSKKLTDGYKYLSVNYRGGKLHFILNNDGIGIEIDSNNRVKHKETIMFLKECLGVDIGTKNKKIELFFEKIDNFR